MLPAPTWVQLALAVEWRYGECALQASVMDQRDARAQRRGQRRSARRDRQFTRRADFLHHALDKVVEDLEFAVKGCDKRFVGLDLQDNLRYHIVPAQDVDPAALRNVVLTLQLRSEAFAYLSGKPVFDLRVR